MSKLHPSLSLNGSASTWEPERRVVACERELRRLRERRDRLKARSETPKVRRRLRLVRAKIRQAKVLLAFAKEMYEEALHHG